MNKYLLFTGFMFAGTFAISQPCSNLFFSEYLEGSSNNKAVEVYNPTTSPINLADYKIYRYNNGSSIASDSLTLFGTLAPGDVFVIANPSAGPGILAEADHAHTITFYNGDDVLMLRQISTLDTLDIFGIIGVDPGTNWPVGTGATSEYTLVRMPGVTEGTTNWSLSSTQWDVYPSDDSSHIGAHTIVPCCTNTTGSLGVGSCFSYTSPSGNYTWTESGIYYDTIPNAGGCDSVITVNLTIDTVNTGISSSGPVATADAVGATYQWVDCNNAFAVIPGETNQSFTATADGDYAVIVTEAGCTDTSACVNITGTGIDATGHGLLFSVYPNPVQANLSFVSPQAGTMVLTGLEGQVVMQTPSTKGINTINISHLPAGIYLLNAPGQVSKARVVKL